MENGLEMRGGLFVPAEKKEPRKFASVRPFVHRDGEVGAFAVAQDGTAWMMLWPGAAWQALPDLPNG